MKNETKSLASQEFEKSSAIEKDLRVLQKKDDIRFGEVHIIESGRETKKILMKHKFFGSKQELGSEIIFAKTRLSFSHENLITFLDYSTGKDSGFCSSVHWMKLYFEYPDLDLEKELLRRARNNIIGLNSHELTHLLYNLVQAGAMLHSKGFAHGDINPKNVEVDRPDCYKLVEAFGSLAKPEEQAYTRAKAGAAIFMSPELYSLHMYSNPKVAKTPVTTQMLKTSDCFSLGFTILFASCDKSLQAFYKPNGHVDIDLLEEYKRSFAQRFPTNKLLTSTVFALLEVDPAKRAKNLQEVEAQLLPYDVVKQSIQQELLDLADTQQDGYASYVQQQEWEHDWVSGSAGQSLANSRAHTSQLSNSQFGRQRVASVKSSQPSSQQALRESYHQMHLNRPGDSGHYSAPMDNLAPANHANRAFQEPTGNQYYEYQLTTNPEPQRLDPQHFSQQTRTGAPGQSFQDNFYPQGDFARQSARQPQFSASLAPNPGPVYSQASNPLARGFGRPAQPAQKPAAYQEPQQEAAIYDYYVPDANQQDLEPPGYPYNSTQRSGGDQHVEYADYSAQSYPNANGYRGY